MTASNLWPILGALATLAGLIIAARIASKATVKASKTAADEEAFVRAKSIYESSIGEQDRRILALVKRIEAVERDLATSRQEVATLRRSVSQYEGRVIQLTEVLRLHDIDVPPWTLNPSDYGMLPGSIPDPGQPLRTEEH